MGDDLKAAKRVHKAAALAAEAAAGIVHQEKKKRKRLMKMRKMGGGSGDSDDYGVKHRQMRVFYAEALEFHRILMTGDGDSDLLYFPDAAK